MNRISFASGIVPGASILDTINAAAYGEFDCVGLWVEPPEVTPQILRGAQAAINDAGLEVLDVEVIWLTPGAMNPDHLRCIDIGAQLGAKNVLVVSADPDMAANAAKLNALCQHAQGTGQRICLEFGVFTAIKSINQALEVIAAADHPLAGLLIDPIHLNRSGAGAADVAAVPRALLPYAQFCDAPLPGPDIADGEAVLADALDARQQLGEGDLPLSEILAALPQGIALSIELRSKALRDGWPDINERARVTALATRAWLKANATP